MKREGVLLSLLLFTFFSLFLYGCKHDTSNILSESLSVQESSSSINLVTTKLATIPVEIYNNFLAKNMPLLFDNNGYWVAYRVDRNNKFSVFINNKESKLYDIIKETEGGYAWDFFEQVFISPDGTKIVFIAKENNKQFVVMNEEEGKRYDVVERVMFSDDSKHVAYTGINKGNDEFGFDNKVVVVIDGKESEMYNEASFIKFLSTNDPVYLGTNFRGNDIEQYLIVGSQKYGPYAHIEPHISENGKIIAYCASSELIGGSSLIVVSWDGWRQFNDLNGCIDSLSPDGNTLIYSYHDDKYRWHNKAITKDGRSFPVEGSWIRFSDDGNHIASVATTGDKPLKNYMVIDGKPEKKVYDLIDTYDIRLSPDGTTLAYIAEERVSDGWKKFLVLNGQEQQGKFDDVMPSSLTLSPDGKHIAFVVNQKTMKQEKKDSVNEEDVENMFDAKPTTLSYTVVDSKPGKIYDQVGYLKFSPDSKHVAYMAKDFITKKSFIVIDGMEGKAYDFISSFTFSQDSSKIAYGARLGNELWWIVDDVPS